MANIGFIGLGNMGSGMASRLLAAGHSVAVFNRTAAKTAALVERGARVGSTPRDACAGASIVICMVADDAASRACWLGSDGILAADLAPGTIAVECSTLSHGWVMELADVVSARGLRYIDCPVTGLPPAAAAGALTLLVGADESDLEQARPVLEALSNRIIRFGSAGTGTAYKLIINMIGAVQIASAAEGLVLAQRAGLDLNVVAAAIETGQAASPQVVRNVRRMVDGDHDQNVVFTPVLRLKDVEYALRLANSLGVTAPFGSLSADGLKRLCAAGRGDTNESVIVEVAAPAIERN